MVLQLGIPETSTKQYLRNPAGLPFCTTASAVVLVFIKREEESEEERGNRKTPHPPLGSAVGGGWDQLKSPPAGEGGGVGISSRRLRPEAASPERRKYCVFSDRCGGAGAGGRTLLQSHYSARRKRSICDVW